MYWIFIISIALSMDAIGIGFSAGVKGIKFSIKSLLTIFLISIMMMESSIYFGEILAMILPKVASHWLGIVLLVFMGIWVIVHALIDKKSNCSNISGKTAELLRNPTYLDMDNSKSIEPKEALFMGFLLSLDSFSSGIGLAALSNEIKILPVLVAGFQILLIFIGSTLGKKTFKLVFKENFGSILSGLILILMATIRIFV